MWRLKVLTAAKGPRMIAGFTQSMPSEYFGLHPVNPQWRLVRRAAEIVSRGGVIAYPTD